MGSCLSKCIPDGDMAAELDAELDATSSYDVDRKNGALFFSTSLLLAKDVKCHNLIGSGPHGSTYKGSYRGSIVAIKKLKMLSSSLKNAARENMESALEVEATRMASLRHPNTVLFMGACLDDKYFCVVTEYCARGSLFNVLHAKQVSTKTSTTKQSSGDYLILLDRDSGNKSTEHKTVKLKSTLRLRLALGAARGLLYLHSADPPLVHAKLKSTNILIDDSWNAKLADFGTGRVADAVGLGESRSASSNFITSLPRWTAPEIFRHGEERILKGKKSSDLSPPEAVDIYSLGMIMWELITGELPFKQQNSFGEIQDMVLSGSRPLIPTNCSLAWQELISRCWAPRPSRRPSAAEVVSTLEKFTREESVAKDAR